MLALFDAHLGALHHGHHDIRVGAAQLPLTPDQSRYIVTNNAGADQGESLDGKLTEIPEKTNETMQRNCRK